jgi:hypothetical protein
MITKNGDFAMDRWPGSTRRLARIAIGLVTAATWMSLYWSIELMSVAMPHNPIILVGFGAFAFSYFACAIVDGSELNPLPR